MQIEIEQSFYSYNITCRIDYVKKIVLLKSYRKNAPLMKNFMIELHAQNEPLLISETCTPRLLSYMVPISIPPFKLTSIFHGSLLLI